MAAARKSQPGTEARAAEKPAILVASNYIRRLYEYLSAMYSISAEYEKYKRSRKTDLAGWAVQLEAAREKMKKESESVRQVIEKFLGKPLKREKPAEKPALQKKFDGSTYFKIIEKEVNESIRLVMEFKQFEKTTTKPFAFNENVEKTAVSLVQIHEDAEDEIRRVYGRFL